ncbi:hypothetical protein [Rhodanobacter hydrolyticus]|uniref:Uncharacterized protein n=1 Tax=Rhodanobacter hydrolyticus TaxID=2250595 RepID=A0ABW8JAP3_9GAMM
MSFELFVQCFENGKPSGIPRDAIRDAFGAFLSEPESSYWHLSFGPRESCSLFLSPLAGAPSHVHSITVERPCADLRLWQGLAQLLAHDHTVLYFPGCPGPLLLNPQTARHLPRDMFDGLGDPIVVAVGQDILRCIEAA